MAEQGRQSGDGIHPRRTVTTVIENMPLKRMRLCGQPINSFHVRCGHKRASETLANCLALSRPTRPGRRHNRQCRYEPHRQRRIPRLGRLISLCDDPLRHSHNRDNGSRDCVADQHCAQNSHNRLHAVRHVVEESANKLQIGAERLRPTGLRTIGHHKEQPENQCRPRSPWAVWQARDKRHHQADEHKNQNSPGKDGLVSIAGKPNQSSPQ